jgi:hypothetical protein
MTSAQHYQDIEGLDIIEQYYGDFAASAEPFTMRTETLSFYELTETCKNFMAYNVLADAENNVCNWCPREKACSFEKLKEGKGGSL